MNRSIWTVVVCGLVLIAGSAFAQGTPDEQTPSRETVCDNETGAAKGLCTAYCEAMDCGTPNQKSSNTACEAVRRNYERKTGRPLPCLVACPCPSLLQLFSQIINREVTVEQCIEYPTLLFVAIEETEDVLLIDEGPPSTCSVNGEPPFVPLNPTELLVCRVSLRKAVESQGVFCNPPE